MKKRKPATNVIAILHQAGVREDEVSRARRVACRLLSVPTVRLCWNEAVYSPSVDDILLPNSTWSQGRVALANHGVNLNVDYLLFLDDDVVLAPPQLSWLVTRQGVRKLPAWLSLSILVVLQGAAIKKLGRELSRVSLFTGCIYSERDWAHRWRGGLKPRPRKTFQIAGHDLQTHIVRRELVPSLFPPPIQGSEGSMFYSHFLGHKIWQTQQLCFVGCEAVNMRRAQHMDRDLEAFTPVDKLLQETKSLFSKALRPSWPTDPAAARHFFQVANKEVFESPRARPIDIRQAHREIALALGRFTDGREGVREE